MKTASMRSLPVALISTAIIGLLFVMGCAQGKPRVLVFLGKDSRSYATMKPIVDKIEKKYQGKIIFENIDYDNPKNKGTIEKYHVSMNPTILIFNAQGQIRQQYLGSIDAEELDSAVQSYMPQPGASKSQGNSTVPNNLKY